MGLITKTVRIKWMGINKNHYESKGYIFTNFKDEFEVKVEDLTKSPKIVVDVMCDCCGKEIKDVMWHNYKKYSKDDGNYYCVSCARELLGADKTRIKTYIKKGKSFKQWCYDNLDNNYADEIMNRWDYKLNGCSPDDVTSSSNKKYWFKCPRGLHESELKLIASFTRDVNGTNSLDCNICNSFAQYLIDTYGENALELYWDYEKNEVDPFEITKSCVQKVFIKCQEKKYHESYETRCNDFYGGKRCPYCSGRTGKLHSKDSLGQYIIDNYGEEFLNSIWSDKNKKSAFEYTCNTDLSVWWKCPDENHEDFKRRVYNSRYADFRCPNCVSERNESFLQEKVRLYLQSLELTILHEHRCTIMPINPKNHKGKMPYDNEVKELKFLIEVHGEQHYGIVGWHMLQANHNKTTPEYEFHMQQVRDRYKRIYAKMNGYNYIEIPYWTDNSEQEWKQLIDNKIQEILKLPA